MSLKDVIDRFALVSGLEKEEISKWIFVIVDCIKYFESNLSKSNLTLSEQKRLAYACAVYAYYKYSLYKSCDIQYKFKAGDVEITQASGAIDCASKMWLEQKAEISDIIDFDGFCFKRVRV